MLITTLLLIITNFFSPFFFFLAGGWGGVQVPFPSHCSMGMRSISLPNFSPMILRCTRSMAKLEKRGPSPPQSSHTHGPHTASQRICSTAWKFVQEEGGTHLPHLLEGCTHHLTAQKVSPHSPLLVHNLKSK